jgi:hypothetical protein
MSSKKTISEKRLAANLVDYDEDLPVAHNYKRADSNLLAETSRRTTKKDKKLASKKKTRGF